jgi:uncharacterized phage-associated protein
MAYFNARKSAQVIAFFVSKNNDPINILKAIKLVYLADRRSLKKFGFPILDETRVSMPHGPVNSTTYSHACGEYDLEASGWSDFLEDRADHMIAAKKKFSVDDLDELSEADIECLEEVWTEFGSMGKWKIVNWTHDRKNIPEWENPNGSSKPIPLERILTMLQIQNADDHVALADDHQHLDSVFEKLRQ